MKEDKKERKEEEEEEGKKKVVQGYVWDSNVLIYLRLFEFLTHLLCIVCHTYMNAGHPHTCVWISDWYRT